MTKGLLVFDISRYISRVQPNFSKAQLALSQEVLKDSNYYAPQDQSDLIRSGIVGSNQDEVVWTAKHANKQYYMYPNKSKDKNPNARMKWFEEGKANNKDKWVSIANQKGDFS